MIPDRDRPLNIQITDAHLHVTLANGRVITLPLSDYPALGTANEQQKTNVQMGIGGLYWPDLNLDISLLTLLSGSPTPRRKGRICEG